MALDDTIQDWFKGQNYLGHPSSLRLTGDTPGDQSGGPNAGVLDAGAPPGGGTPAPTGTSGAAPQSTVMPGGAGLSPVIRALLAGQGILGKAQTISSPLLSGGSTGSFARSPEIEDAFQAFRSGERMDFGGLSGFGSAEVLPQVSGGELALGSEGAGLAGEAATAGSAAAEGALINTGMAAINEAAPIWSGLTAAVDLLGEGKIPFQDIIDLIAPGTFGPSEAWLSYPGRLGQTLQTEAGATNTLANALLTAQSPQDVQNLIAAWRSEVGGAIPGFGSGETDPYALTALPGAGGTKGGSEGKSHEPFNVDFGPTQGGLAAEIQAALHGLSPEDRIAAFQSGAQPLLDASTAKRAASDQAAADWQRQFDLDSVYNQGSA